MILTVRIQKGDQRILDKFARQKHLNRSQAVKELLHKGFIVAQMQEYRDGKLSLGKLAETLGVARIEALNLVAQYNAHPKMPRDYLADAMETAKGLPSKKT